MTQENKAPKPFRDFFSINVWNVVILISWLCAGVWTVSKWKTSIEILDKRIAVIEAEYKNLDIKLETLSKSDSLFNNYYKEQFVQRDNLFDTRITKLEEAVNKIGSMATDIQWLKEYTIRNNQELQKLFDKFNDKK